MSRQLTALNMTAGVTYCTNDGTPYRADTSGIVHVEAKHVSELVTVRGVATTTTAAQMAATHHRGMPLVLTVEA